MAQLLLKATVAAVYGLIGAILGGIIGFVVLQLLFATGVEQRFVVNYGAGLIIATGVAGAVLGIFGYLREGVL